VARNAYCTVGGLIGLGVSSNTKDGVAGHDRAGQGPITRGTGTSINSAARGLGVVSSDCAVSKVGCPIKGIKSYASAGAPGRLVTSNRAVREVDAIRGYRPEEVEPAAAGAPSGRVTRNGRIGHVDASVIGDVNAATLTRRRIARYCGAVNDQIVGTA